jgi:class 3 adenylate cyclase/tetratricopeptide (TPR) repeat protein
MDQSLIAYLPQDRRTALARGWELPEATNGAALFADLSGFTTLTEAFDRAHGPRRGAEELTILLNRVYDTLIAKVDGYGGNVISFAGDAIMCWFDDAERLETGDLRLENPGPAANPQPPAPAPLRAATCALAMQAAMARFARVALPDGGHLSLALKVAVAAGPARRFVVGDPAIQLIDTLAGATLERVVAGEQLARQGEALLDRPAATALGAAAELGEWRVDAETGQQFAVLAGLRPPALSPRAERDGVASASLAGLDATRLRPWVLPAVYARHQAGLGDFMAELRPVVALFLHFGGIEFEYDADAARKLDSFVRHVQASVQRYGGTLLQLTIGDKGSYLYAAFGAPAAHDDDAERAIACALKLRATQAQHLFIATQRIGITRGQMYTGVYGGAVRRTYGALGDKTNLAARLMTMAPAGEIFCDSEVYRSARHGWVFEELPPLRVKGKVALVPIYRPTGARARGGAAAPSADALIGRRAEAARLAASLDAAMRGESGLLLIDGEAGIGKSRLVAELRRRAHERGLTELLGAGQSIEQQAPYRAWRDVFSTYFGLPDDYAERRPSTALALAERQDRVVAHVAAAAPALIGRLPLLDDLLSLELPDSDLTRALDPAMRSESLDGMLVELLHAWAAEQPLLLVLDDAQWLDSRSWALAVRVAQALIGGDPATRTSKTLFVVLMRPLDAGHPALAAVMALLGLPGARRLALGPLGRDDTVALAAARLGLPQAALPQAVVELVQARADGNPLFAEQLVATLSDQGLIDVAAVAGAPAPGWIVRDDVRWAAETVPETLQGLLLARIDRLPPEEQLTLKVAAVVGPMFDYPPLHYARSRHAAIEGVALKNQLRGLAARGLTWLEAPEPHLSYRFKHILAHEATYQTLLYAQRRELHRNVAAWYEQLAGEGDGPAGQPAAATLAPYLPLLAHHYRQAEDAERERHYAHLAGIQAAEQFANAEAVLFLSRALALTPAGAAADRYAVLLARERVYDMQGDREAQAADLATLAALAERLHDGVRQAEVALRRANYAEVTGDFGAAIAAAREAAALAAASGAAASEAAAYFREGRALILQGAYAEARVPLEQALARARSAGQPRVEADSLRNLGLAALNQSDYASAGAYGEQALALFHAIGDQRGTCATLANRGDAAYFQGDYAAARVAYEEVLRMRREIGDRLGECDALGNLGSIVREQGEWARARECYEQALALCRTIAYRWGEIGALHGLGNIAAYHGDYSPAQQYQEQALAQCRAIGDRLGETISLLHLAELADAQGDYVAAADGCQRALDILRAIGHRQHESWALALLGQVSHHQGDDALAERYGRQALAFAEEVGAHSEQGRAWLVLGHALAGQGRQGDAAGAYGAALAVRRSLGEQHLANDVLAGLAELALAQDDRVAAAEHAGAILAYLEEKGNLDGAAEPFRAYLVCYRALHALDDPRAHALLQTAYERLTEQSARIADPGRRHAFLAMPTAHRTLAALWQAARGP